MRENWTEKHCNVARKIFFWKVDGRKRDCSILIGRTPVNVKPEKMKGQKSTGFSTAQNGTKSDSRSFQEVGAKSKNFKGAEVAKRYCHASSQ